MLCIFVKKYFKVYQIVLLLFCCSSIVFGQQTAMVDRVHQFQEKLNQKFATAETSPLTKEDRQAFKGVNFFNIDATYNVIAKFVRTPYETPFIMETTTNRAPVYVKYGEAHFTLHQQNYVLNIYQSQALQADPEHQNYLFLPFTDSSNGDTSYEGGRFIDLTIPKGHTITIDFNMAYNPYCAYNARYSCPKPPKRNHLNIAILAGVKKKVTYLNN